MEGQTLTSKAAPNAARVPKRGSMQERTADDALLQLARQSEGSVDTRRLHALQRLADNAPIVQRVKTEEVPLATIQNPVRQGARDALGGGPNCTPAAILGAARAAYQENLNRGRNLLQTLNDRQTGPDNDFEPENVAPSQEELAARSAANATTFGRRYKTRVAADRGRPDMDYSVATRGRGADENAYTNMYSLENNAIETATNYAARDPNRATGNYLNNSEIFWNQWKAAVKKGTGGVRHRGRRRAAKTRELSQITRAFISNGNSGLTAHYALPDGVYFGEGHQATFGPDQEEFAALLGTPNGRAVGYLLNDHFHEMDNPNHAGVHVDGDRSAFVFRFGP